MRVSILSLLFVLGILAGLIFFTYDNAVAGNIIVGNNDGNTNLENIEYEDLRFEKVRERKLLEKGDGIVVNIWMDETALDKFLENNIKYLFVDIGGIDSDGKLTTDDEDLRSFLDFISKFEQEKQHDFVLIPYTDINTYEYDFMSEEFQDNFVSDNMRLHQMGFDWIYVDIEPVRLEQRKMFLIFLERMNNAFSDNVLGVYAGHLGDIENEWVWDEDFYEKVSERVDFIFMGFYESGAESEEKYKTYVKSQINGIAARNWNSYFIFGIPSYKEDAESLESAFNVYETSEISKDVLGLTIFAEWTTDKDEWSIIRNYLA